MTKLISGIAIVLSLAALAMGRDLGTATGKQVPCSQLHVSGGEPGGVCYAVVTSCPGVADITAGVKVNQPTHSVGTVTLTGGGGDPAPYDRALAHGTDTVHNMLAAGLRTAQIFFPTAPTGFAGGQIAGWSTGPGGMLALSCRWATVAHWVHENVYSDGPFCHTGNSGGSAAIAYGLAAYGSGKEATFVELTSGPPYSAIDRGCSTGQPTVPTPCGAGSRSPTYATSNSLQYVDPSYNPKTHVCSQHLVSSHAAEKADSLLAPTSVLQFPDTTVRFLFGGKDTGSAVPQATWFLSAITAKALTQGCAPQSAHGIADDAVGAATIANDIVQNCK